MSLPDLIRKLSHRLIFEPDNTNKLMRCRRSVVEHALHIPYVVDCVPCSEITLKGDLTDPTPRLCKVRLVCYKIEDIGWLWAGECYHCGRIYFSTEMIE